MDRTRIRKLRRCVTIAGVVGLLLAASQGWAISNDDCLDCHNDPDLTTEKNGKEYSLFVDGDQFAASIHADNGCISCHEEAEVDGDEHPFPMTPVACGNCHDVEEADYGNSLHGKEMTAGDEFAPHCYDCHSKHYILPETDKHSTIFKLNIPFTCGRCHKEGSDTTKAHDFPEKNILENYSMSIHGEGLFRKGLTVTAVCSSCHTGHNILPHTDPESTISRFKVVKTCMKCHANIETVHIKIVRGELWEKAPNKVPVCVECHSPHKTRRVLYEDSMNDGFCMVCHANPDLKQISADGTERRLFVNINEFNHSIHKHKRIACVKCHVNVTHQSNPVCKDSGPVDCAICHADQQKLFDASTHGRLHAGNNPNAPYCTDCHGSHDILPQKDKTSPIFARNIPDLCGKCHREGERAALRYTGSQHEIVKHYKMSIHGKGLEESGLMVSATCTNCHTAHSILPADDPNSSVNHDKIIDTCAQCHLGIAEKFRKSIHSPAINDTKKKLPVCIDCHTSHTIRRVDLASFRNMILAQCGTCHEEQTETYLDTYHGKASLLSGGEKSAKCSDCHGSHDILPTYYARSNLNQRNVVATCRKCHPDSNRKFTGYLTHATHHDKKKYPFLYYTFWAMTSLLLGTFSFFGLHTLFWIPCSFRERFKRRREHSRERFFKDKR